MQKITYDVLSSRDPKIYCVGSYDEHQKYPYEQYLLENYNSEYKYALDFGCGIGRMIKRMNLFFDRVDGIDISEINLKYAKNYCGDCKNKPLLFLTEGMKFDAINSSRYNFVYSTIAMQHIAVHAVRVSILSEMFRVLVDGGSIAIQMTYIDDIHKHPKYNRISSKVKPLRGVASWSDNAVWAMTTNSGYDTVLDKKGITDLKSDLRSIGFKSIVIKFAPSPHIGTEEYVFIYAKK